MEQFAIPIMLAAIGLGVLVADHYTRQNIKNNPMPPWEPSRPEPGEGPRTYRFRRRRRRNG